MNKNQKYNSLFLKRNLQGVKPRKKIVRGFRKQKIIKAPHQKKRKVHTRIILVLITILIVLCCRYIEKQIMPVVVAMAEMKIQTLSTRIINQAVEESLKEKEIDTDDLVMYYYNQDGEITSIGVNTVLVNEICSDVIYRISEDVDVYESTIIDVPLGYFIEDGVFSDWGPNIPVNVTPYGTAKINYGREFVSTGINQINHRIWLEVKMTMRVVIPLNSKEIKISQQVTLVDGIVKGDIPDQYVQVPDENILDVAPD